MGMEFKLGQKHRWFTQGLVLSIYHHPAHSPWPMKIKPYGLFSMAKYIITKSYGKISKSKVTSSRDAPTQRFCPISMNKKEFHLSINYAACSHWQYTTLE